jgi:hypothetical protein
LFPLKIVLNPQKEKMTEHEQNLRDLAALFAMTALLIRNEYNAPLPQKEAFRQADLFMKQRAKENANADRRSD